MKRTRGSKTSTQERSYPMEDYMLPEKLCLEAYRVAGKIAPGTEGSKGVRR